MGNRIEAAQDAVIRLSYEHESYRGIANHLGIPSAHISNLIKKGCLGPTLETALVVKGYLPEKPKRIGVFIGASYETQKRFNELARKSGLSRSEYFEYVIGIMERE